MVLVYGEWWIETRKRPPKVYKPTRHTVAGELSDRDPLVGPAWGSGRTAGRSSRQRGESPSVSGP